MQLSESLFAWIEQRCANVFSAAFVGAGAVAGVYQGHGGRLPAVREFSLPEEARGWVNEQAELLPVSVSWLEKPPEGFGGRLRMRG